MTPEPLRLFLVAPNVSAQMGGEAIKALQIFEEMQSRIGNVVQITHVRNKAELSRHRHADRVVYLADDIVDRMLWKSFVLRPFMTLWFSYRAIRCAELMCNRSGQDYKTIIHQTEPNSPVAPRWTSAKFLNVFGPINGNIYYPESFRNFESWAARIRRVLHFPLQRFNRLHRRGLIAADVILAAGGRRTIESLRAAGVRDAQLVETLDCGIPDDLHSSQGATAREHKGRFIHFGRLVFHKGTTLAIEAVFHAGPNVTLDIVGRGPELTRCMELVKSLGLENRVQFLNWYDRREDLLASFVHYSGMVLPSIEDANGIVVQESMAVGLVPICLEWGGPQLLIEDCVSGFLIKPGARAQIVSEIGRRLDQLAADSSLASRMSNAAMLRAESWKWSKLSAEWINVYRSIRPTSVRGDGNAP